MRKTELSHVLACGQMRKDAEDLHLEMESVAEEVSTSPVVFSTASPDLLARLLLSSLLNEFALIE